MQTIITRYHHATDTKGARYSATSSSGLRIMIKESPDWTHDDMGHIAAVNALKRKIGHGFEGPMIAGSLKDGALVWVFIDERSPRSVAKAPGLAELKRYTQDIADCMIEAPDGEWIRYEDAHRVLESHS